MQFSEEVPCFSINSRLILSLLSSVWIIKIVTVLLPSQDLFFRRNSVRKFRQIVELVISSLVDMLLVVKEVSYKYNPIFSSLITLLKS